MSGNSGKPWECGKARDPMYHKSPVCDKYKGHAGRHHYDVNGKWGTRNERGGYDR